MNNIFNQIFPVFSGMANWEFLTSIGTLALAGLTFSMVWEMKKTREQSNKPFLMILNPIHRYEFRWIPQENVSFILRPELRAGDQFRYDSRLPVFRLKNIGSAPAKNIKFSWSVQGPSINTFLDNPILKRYHARFESGIFSISLENSEGNVVSAGRECADHDLSDMDYCIASPITDFDEPINIPSGISASYELRMLANPRPLEMSVLNGPDINLNVSFDDLENKITTKQFIIRSRFTFLPDSISSESNALDPKFSHADNMRGFMTFHVKIVN